MKINKAIKLALSCAVLLLFIGGSIAAAGQTDITAQNKHTQPGKVMSPDRRYIYNETDFDNAVISSGTITVPYTEDINERHKISKNAINNLYKQFKVPPNEIVSLECDFKKGNCTYEISKPVEGTAIASGEVPSAPSTPFKGWAESATYYDAAGTTSFNGHWNVPRVPNSQIGQAIAYFIALEHFTPQYGEIIQPVLEWNNGFGPQWDIASWYCMNGKQCQRDAHPKLVSVNDNIAGYLEYEVYQGKPIQWWIFTEDITQGTESTLNIESSGVWNLNYIALEFTKLEVGVNSCSNFPGGADFTGLSINNAIPSWTPWINSSAAAVCPSMGVNIVSPNEVQLKAFPNDTVGVYRSSTGTFYLKNSNNAGNTDITVPFGPVNPTNIIPLAGDWNGDGIDTIGIYQKSTGTFFLKNSFSGGSADITVPFGPVNPTDIIPLVGDWNGDGTTTIGVYQKSTSTFFLKNSFSGGNADITFVYGLPGDIPVTGDWNGQGITTVGVYRSGVFYLRNSNNANADITFGYGVPSDTPVTGNWDGK
ncbi:MAG: hypothetical protein O8C56_01320 [Candidatus Methanoperedens sp.]|nr:hypothetical protein [Candidatus Methanoperedens sp.]